MAKMLVTGGAGFIGSNIAEELLRKGHSVRVLDNLTTGRKGNIDTIKDSIEVINGDIRKLDVVKKAVEDMDYVFHLAAQVSVPMSVENPLLTEEVNVMGTLNVLKASKDSGIKRVIYSSSCAIYGDASDMPIKENTQKRPLSPYALTKLVSEEYCKLFYKQYGLKTVSLRYFNAYGPMQNPESLYAAVIPKFICLLLKDEQPVIYGDGKQTRDFVFVRDVIQANILAINTKGISGHVFNIGSGKATSVNELFEIICNILGKDVKPKYEKPRHGDIKHSLADITKARKRLGYEPKYTLEEGLEKTVEWLKSSLYTKL